MLLPCRLKTQISTASSATNMRPSALEYPTSGWVIFQSAALGQFCTGTNYVKTLSAQRQFGEQRPEVRRRFVESNDRLGTRRLRLCQSVRLLCFEA